MTDMSARREHMGRAAWLYYERGLNQQAVADRLGLSRSTVSRLLADAVREGVVRITITEPLPETAILADRLVEQYGLVTATVELALEEDSPMDAAATAMARRLESLVAGGPITIAAGWGRTLGKAAQTTRNIQTSGIVVVDAFGHTTTEDIAPAVEVTNSLGRKFGAEVIHIPSPGFAPSAEVAENFLSSGSVSTTLDRARSADVVIVAVGIVGKESLLITAGYIDQSTMSAVVKAGAVGEVFGRYFDAEGKEVMPDALYPISLTLDDLRNARRVIAAAGGADKKAAVRGALRAGIVDELAVDDSLARALVE
jgi:DNA-binding transcriptional regulator LsrR (DeoR family)